MEPFPPSQEPDEGYSEHPLNTAAGNMQDNAAMLALRSPPELPAWLATQMPKFSIQQKKELAILILNELPTTAIAEIVMTQLNPRLYINFVYHLPPEICLKILGELDAMSLIRFAQCCRAWYDLATDRKLWEGLYYSEGWKAIVSEIKDAEQRMNEHLTPSPMHPQTVNSIEGGHISKKRAISDYIPKSDDPAPGDQEMIDIDTNIGQEHKDTHMSSTTSLFGGPQVGGNASSQKTTSVLRSSNDLIAQSSGGSTDRLRSRQDKGKGKAVVESPRVSPPLDRTSDGQSRLPKSTLWVYDSRDRRYKLSWKHLYSMRRKLESNWDRGRFTNFQLPHPDHPEEGHNECIYSIQFNSDYLVSGSRDRTLRIWDLRTRRLVRPPLAGHNGSVLCLQFDSDPEEDIVVSGSSDSDVILWRFSTGEIIQRLKKAHRESVLNVKFDKRILVTCSKDRTIKIFNRRPLRAGDLGLGDAQPVSPVPVNLRNYGFEDSPLDQVPITPPYTMIACLEGHNAAVNAVQIRDREIVSASGDRYIRLWDWPTQVVKRTFIGHSKGIACVQYDGRRIVSGSSDHEVKVFDSESALEVASLRAHSNLVRTVQAGFGDLPDSREEDQRQARAIDQAYFQALNTGSLDEARLPRRRAYNAGSRRPEDITAYGAKLPPGGGGGPYGRIVSGSYDQSIIIWRRDREGVWRSAQILRQEEAATAAVRQSSRCAASATPRRPTPLPATAHVNTSAHRADHATGSAPLAQPASAPPTLQRPPPPTYTQVDHPIHATITPQTTASYTQMIDSTVPQGPAALHALLNSFPTTLTYSSHIQAAIDAQHDPIVRAQLREVVSTTLVRTQIAQNRIREAVQQTFATEPSTSHATPSRPSRPFTISQMLSDDPPGPSTSGPPSIASASAGGGPPPDTMSSVHALHSHRASSQQRLSQPLPAPVYSSNPTTGQAQVEGSTQLQGPQTALTHSQAVVDAQPHPQPHPHPPPQQADAASPARIFKLQFDARRIICCSQVSTIVGWDFCNGDPELEEVARFFGTVD
ncbi:WD40 repeat-like protein [Xylariaceae sp. FL0594]|nr:WD40 repeat-like protein [Xylariaceae sp. FL0594]